MKVTNVVLSRDFPRRVSISIRIYWISTLVTTNNYHSIIELLTK